MVDMNKYRKALVPVGVAIILAVLAKAGITPDMSIQNALGLIVSAGLVWLVPNKD